MPGVSDRTTRKEKSTKHLSWPFKLTNATTTVGTVRKEYPLTADVESWASWDSLTSTANHGDRGFQARGANSSKSAPKVSEPKDKTRAPDVVDNPGVSPAGPSRNHDHVLALKVHRTTNEHVLQKAFELNAASAALFKDTKSLVHSLEPFMREMDQFTSAAIDLPSDLITSFRSLQQNYETVRNDHITAFQIGQDRYANIEHDIIQSLLRSSRYLDRFFKSDAVNPNLSLGPEPTFISLESTVDIGDEVVKRSASVVQYLSQVGDIDAIQEKLTDLYLEYDQLLSEKESRARFGLSLDEESQEFLTTFHEREQILVDELEYAEIVMEALRQLVHDKEALEISNDAYTENRDEKPEMIDIADFVTGTFDRSGSSPQAGNQTPALLNSRADNMTFDNYYDGSDPTIADTARFINTWMLHRVGSQPAFLSKFSYALEKHYSGLPAEDLETIFFELWFNDSSATGFRDNRTIADEQSMYANRADSQNPEPESVPLPPQQSQPFTLLRTGPQMTVEEIIAQAVRTRGDQSSHHSGE